MKFFLRLLAISMVFCVFTARAENVEALKTAEMQSLIAGLQSNELSQINDYAGQILASGITNTEVYDVVLDVLNDYHKKLNLNPKDKETAKTVVWLLRALGASGNQRYSNDLDRILHESKSRSVRNRAKHAHSKLYWYEKRNQIMSNANYYQEGHSLFTSRMLALLDSDDPTLSRWAATEVYRQDQVDPVIIDTMMKKLNEEARGNVEGPIQDRLAWFCRCSAHFSADHFAQDIQSLINDKAVHPKIRKHCKKELQRSKT